MEYISLKDCEPLAKAMNLKQDTYGKYENGSLLEIQNALIDTTNKVMWVNVQKVAELLSKCLKTPKTSIYEYVSNCAMWVIENKRQEIIKPTGRFINIIDLYNDLREANIEFDKEQAKVLELICNHICYENPFKQVSDVMYVHRCAIKKTKTFDEYLNYFISEVKLNLPIEFLKDKAKEFVKSYDEIVDILS